MTGGYEDLCRALGVEQRGDSTKARCPCHSDDAPSLSVTRTDSGGFVVKCHAGCPQHQVFARCRELAGDAPRDRARRFEHVYRDEDGEVFAVKVREYAEDGSKRMTWDRKLNGRPAPLYRLPRLIEAGERGSRVWIVEGERKVEDLERLGLVATSPPSGGSASKVGAKWRDEWARYFTGLEVVILADADDPGRNLANHIARQLAGVAYEVRVLELAPPRGGRAPKGYDVSDWLAEGGTLEQLEQLVARATPGQLLAIEQPPLPAPPAGTNGTHPPLDDDGWGSELWFARRLVAEHGADLRYVGAWSKWYAYNAGAGRWSEDQTGEVMRRAKLTAGGIVSEGIRAAAEARRANDPAKIDLAIARLKLAKKFFGRMPLEHAVRLASSEASIVATPEQWDRDPMLFAVANGVLELRTGKLRPAAREDYLTKGSPVVWNPNALCPTWHAYLERIQPDADVRAYLQRMLGWALIAGSTEHLLHVFFGAGQNGKSKFVGTMAHIWGSYYTPAPPSLLIRQGNSNRHPTELALLHGMRVAIASETAEGGRLLESQVKSLTGGDRIVARRMKEDFWSFEPMHHLFLMTNHRPRISGTDHGIWRRIRLIPFAVQITEAEKIGDLQERLNAEGAGILAWIVEGCLAYLQVGLNPPEAIADATDDYRDDEDELGDFIEGELLAAPGSRVTGEAVYARYDAWASAEGVPEKFRIRPKALTRKLKERGFQQSPRGDAGKRGWLNVELRQPDEKPWLPD